MVPDNSQLVHREPWGVTELVRRNVLNSIEEVSDWLPRQRTGVEIVKLELVRALRDAADPTRTAS